MGVKSVELDDWEHDGAKGKGTYRDNEPVRLDLVFTREVQLSENIQYKCPLGKIDHAVMEMETEEGNGDRNESYKENTVEPRIWCCYLAISHLAIG